MSTSRPKAKRGGRKKGVPNKATKAVKDALIEAFDKLGGVPALVRFGKKNPAAFYALWSKLLPTEVKTSGKITVRVEVEEEVIDADAPTHDQDQTAPGPA